MFEELKEIKYFKIKKEIIDSLKFGYYYHRNLQMIPKKGKFEYFSQNGPRF